MENNNNNKDMKLEDDLSALSLSNDLPSLATSFEALATTTGSSKGNGGQHIMLSFTGDTAACTNDPEEMSRNYRFKLGYVSVENEVNVGNDFGSMVTCEFVVSSDYMIMKSPENPELRRLMEEYKQHSRGSLSSSNAKNRRKVIKRSPLRECDFNWSQLRKCRDGKIKKTDCKQQKTKKVETARSAVNSQEEAGGTDENPIVAEFKDVRYSVAASSLKTLTPGTYINDEIIDYGIYERLRIHRASSDTVYAGTYGWVFFFFTDEAVPGFTQEAFYKIVTRRGKEPDLLRIKYLVIPVQREKHWFLVIVCRPFPDEFLITKAENLVRTNNIDINVSIQDAYNSWVTADGEGLGGGRRPVILVFDSMYETLQNQTSNVDGFHLNTADYIRQGLLTLHQVHWNKIGKNFKVPSELFNETGIPQCTVKVPQQSNSEDCGIFCMEYVSHFFMTMRTCNDNYGTAVTSDFRGWFNPSVSHRRQDLFGSIRRQCEQLWPARMPHVLEYEPMVLGLERVFVKQECD